MPTKVGCDKTNSAGIFYAVMISCGTQTVGKKETKDGKEEEVETAEDKVGCTQQPPCDQYLTVRMSFLRGLDFPLCILLTIYKY